MVNVIIGVDSQDLAIKSFRVVHLAPMGKLVHDYRVDDLRACQHKQAIEAEISACRAATPARPLKSVADPSVVDSHPLGVMRNALGKIFLCGALESLAFLLAQRRDIRKPLAPFSIKLKMLAYPIRVLGDKSVDISCLHSLWRADDDLTVFYLQGNRAPVAFYQIVFEFFHISLRRVVFDVPSTLIIPHSRPSVKR